MTELEKKEFIKNLQMCHPGWIDARKNECLTLISDGASDDDTFLKYAYCCYEMELRECEECLQLIDIDELVNSVCNEFDFTDTEMTFIQESNYGKFFDDSMINVFGDWCSKKSDEFSTKDILDEIDSDEYNKRSFSEWFYVQMDDAIETESFTLIELLHWYKEDYLREELDAEKVVRCIIYDWIWSEFSQHIEVKTKEKIDSYFNNLGDKFWEMYYEDFEKDVREILIDDEYLKLKELRHSLTI